LQLIERFCKIEGSMSKTDPTQAQKKIKTEFTRQNMLCRIQHSKQIETYAIAVRTAEKIAPKYVVPFLSKANSTKKQRHMMLKTAE